MSTEKIRAQSVSIEVLTESCEPWVHCVLQKVFKDAEYKTVQTVDRTGGLHRLLSEFATEVREIQDPVTGQQLVISGAGLGLAVSEFVKQWILADVPGCTTNEYGDIVRG